MIFKRFLYFAIGSSIFETGHCSEEDEPCNLFKVTCDTSTGFTISIIKECKDEQYGHLHPENKGLFVWGKDLEAENADEPKLEDVDDKCKFDKEGSVTVNFKECGGSSHSDAADSTIYATFVHHRASLGPIATSSLDQAPIQCKMPHIDISINPVGVAESDEETGVDLIDSDETIQEFQLKLKVGSVLNGKFDPFVDGYKVDVGNMVRIQLKHKQAPYEFVLRDCEAIASKDETEHKIGLYKEYCPGENSKMIGMKWGNTKQFDFNIFRVGDTNELVIACKVVLLPENSDLSKYDCPTSRRRREVEIRSIVKRQSDDQAVETSGTVAVTIDLTNAEGSEKWDERTMTDSSGNPISIFVAPSLKQQTDVEATTTASSLKTSANLALFMAILKL